MVTAIAVLILFAALWAVALYYGSRPLTPDDIAQDAPVEPPPAPRRIQAESSPAATERVFTVVLKEGTRYRHYTGKGRRPFRLIVDSYAFEPKGSINGIPLYVRSEPSVRQTQQAKRR
jgi:hypothetical protein